MPLLIPREQLDAILNRVDLIATISEYVPLKKAGTNYKGLCPFHQEKSPSFVVSPTKGLFHCFGCGEGGNLFGFLMRMEKLTFPEAAKKLALVAGIDLTPYEGKGEAKQDEKDILYRINRYAAWFFAENLKKPIGQKGLSYIRSRGLKDEALQEFQMGYAPDSWEGLTRFLASKKVPLELAFSLGLIKKRKDGSYYDFFRDRLMFPIVDLEGRIIGFGGRKLSDTKKEEAKYINSLESPIYHKGLSIYGLFQAKKAVRESGELILVEGYLDLISLSQSGIKNAVAPLGTALTPPQIQTLKRFSDKIVLLFDGDSAGIQASLRGIPLLFKAGLHPKVVELPPGEDPDSFVQKEGATPLLEKIAKAPLAMEWIMIRYLSNRGSRPSDKIEAAKQILPYIQGLPSQLEQKSYASKLNQFLGLSDKEFILLEKPPSRKESPSPPLSIRNQGKISLERILLQLYVKDPLLMEELLGKDIFHQFEDSGLKKLAFTLKNQFQEKGTLELTNLLEPESPFDENLISELALGADEWEDESSFKKWAKDCAYQWRYKKLQRELKKITEEIQLAELKADKESLNQLIANKNQVAKEIKQFKKNL